MDSAVTAESIFGSDWQDGQARWILIRQARWILISRRGPAARHLCANRRVTPTALGLKALVVCAHLVLDLLSRAKDSPWEWRRGCPAAASRADSLDACKTRIVQAQYSFYTHVGYV